MKIKNVICFSVVFGLLGAVSGFAQNAALVGTVRDSQQAIVPGATVTLTNVDTGVELTTKSDETGIYEFPTVRPGNYSLKVEQPGFQSFTVQSLVLAVGQRSRVDAMLQVGAISAEVRIEAFNILNHPNFAQPNRTVTSGDFGRITATRTARGDLGSSRQIQLGLKLTF